MRLLRYNSPRFARDLAAFCRGARVPAAISQAVTAILAAIASGGDRAVSHYARQFDGARLTPAQFRVDPAEIATATKRVAPADRRAMKAAHAAIVAYNRHSLPANWSARNLHGAEVGERHHAIRRVGLYVPGGQVPLVSTVLMTATLARLAGCPEIAVFTPSDREGRVADGLLAALHLVGVEEVYRLGGVQAIGAMAYGTRTIRAVDKVFGPGNAYVCEAKRQVFGTVGVDSLPGPSEVMVIADEAARPDFAAADLLAQAEHGSGREKIYLIATSRAVFDSIVVEVKTQLPLLSRAAAIAPVLRDGFAGILVENFDEAAAVANQVAPEHLELLVAPRAATKLRRTITTAGSILIGNYSPTALGDFAAGPSHVLPTGGAGRFFSGLRVADFMRRTSELHYDATALARAAPVVAALAALERLDAHGRSVAIRTL